MSRSNARSPHANSEHEMAKLPIIGKSANISTNQQQLGGKKIAKALDVLSGVSSESGEHLQFKEVNKGSWINLFRIKHESTSIHFSNSHPGVLFLMFFILFYFS